MTLQLVKNDRESSQGSASYALAGELCVFNVAEMKTKLFEAMAPDERCELDLSQVSEVDTAGVQLLLAAKREAEAIKCQLQFVQHSDPVLEIMELLNLSGDFGDPVILTRRGD